MAIKKYVEYRYTKMKLITNIQPPFLTDILLKQFKDLKEIKAAVAYCKDYKLLEYCKKHKIKLNYYGRLDSSINLNLKDLKNFLTSGDISIHIIGGAKFHPKIIWCYDYGAYIGSANLTKSAWEENIECGLWLTQKELKDNYLINSLNDFFTFIQQKSKLLSSISDQDILELNKYQPDNSENPKISAMIKRLFGNFEGCSKKEHSNINPPSKKKFQPDQQTANKPYKKGSGWNDVTEMMCLLISKILAEENFPRRRQTGLCREMADIPNIGLKKGTISAKVSNYKSVSGVNNPSNASKHTKRIYKQYHKLSIKELTEKIQSLTKYKFTGFSKKG